MKLLLDTHLLIWSASTPQRLSSKAKKLIEDDANALYFSAASICEVTIKAGLGREDFNVNPTTLRQGLLENDYQECPITGQHALALSSLPDLHRDPFDRMLIAQALVEGFCLFTRDAAISAYPGNIIAV